MNSYSAKKPYESSKKTKKDIQKAFLAIAETVPFYKVSVSEICKEMGITRTAFYYHFDDLYAVIDSILDEVITSSGLAEVFAAWAQKTDVPIDMACKIALDCIGRFTCINRYQALLTNSMLSGYAVDYIIAREKDLVIAAIMRDSNVGRINAERLFRFSFAGMFYISRNQCWEYLSSTVYCKEEIRSKCQFIENPTAL